MLLNVTFLLTPMWAYLFFRTVFAHCIQFWLSRRCLIFLSVSIVHFRYVKYFVFENKTKIFIRACIRCIPTNMCLHNFEPSFNEFMFDKTEFIRNIRENERKIEYLFMSRGCVVKYILTMNTFIRTSFIRTFIFSNYLFIICTIFFLIHRKH